MHSNWQRSNISRSRTGAGQFRPTPDPSYSVIPQGPTVTRGNSVSPQQMHTYNYNAPGMNSGTIYGAGSYSLGRESQNWLPDDFQIEQGIDLPWGVPVAAAYRHQPAPGSATHSPSAWSASEYTPSSSSDEVYLPDSDGSSRCPIQGSDYFCPATPTYAWSLPRMSPLSQGSPQNSQGSRSSFSSRPHDEHQNTVLMNEVNHLLYTTDYYEYFSGSDSGSLQSQPEMKRMRFGN